MKRYLRFISLLLLVFLPCSASSTSVGLNDKTLPFSHYPLSFSEAYESVATDHKTLFYRLPPQTEVCRRRRQTFRQCFIRLSPRTRVYEYRLSAQIRDNEITGICILNADADNIIVGTIVNEFGVKVFDFSYANGKVKIFNVIHQLDKWFIKRILRKDFLFFLSNFRQDERTNAINGNANAERTILEKKRSMRQTADGKIIVCNNKYKIMYTFTPISDAP